MGGSVSNQPIDISKLPKYAQEEIISLHRRVRTLKQSLEEQKQSTPTKISWGRLLDDHAGGYLPDEDRVEFRISKSMRVRARITEDGLYINADHGIAILCESSNCFTVAERIR